MVATVLRLKFTILGHTLRREPWRVVVLVAGLIWALATLPSVVGGMVWLSRQPSDVTRDVLVIAGAVLVLGWVIIPLLLPGMDDSLDVARFATFRVPVRRLVPALLVASLLAVPTAFTGVVSLAPVIAWSGAGGRGAALVALVSAPLALATCVLAARISTGVVSRLLGTRRSRELGAVAGLLVVAAGTPVVIWLGSVGLEGALERVPLAASVLGWTPFGLVWAAPAAMAQGSPLGAFARVVLAAAWVAAGVVAWSRLLQRALVRPPSLGGQVRRRTDAILPARHRNSRAGAIAATAITRRALRYWGADPRYVTALLGAVIAPVVIVLLVATVVDAPAAVALSMGPLMAGSIGWGRHNDLAFDGSAFWLHVAARVPGWADRLGRVTATLVWAVPVTVVVSVGGALVGGRPDLAPAAVGAALGVLCAGLAVSCLFSSALPYPVPSPGANPFAAEMGALGASMAAQLVTSGATLALCLPLIALYAGALWSAPVYAVLTVVVGVLGGASLLAGGVVAGGRVYDARAARVLVKLS